MRLWYLSHRRSAPSRQGLRCSHTESMKVDEGSDQKSDIQRHWMAALARLKNEFTEDKKYHKHMTWLKFPCTVPSRGNRCRVCKNLFNSQRTTIMDSFLSLDMCYFINLNAKQSTFAAKKCSFRFLISTLTSECLAENGG